MWWKREARDFRAELDAHLQLEADELRSEGLPPAEALAAARRALGNRTSAEERFYESGRWMFGQHFLRDLRFAARMLMKDAKFSVLAILGLALGIGVSTAIVAFFHATQPHGDGTRPFEDVLNRASYIGIDRRGNFRSFSFPEYRYFQDHATALAEVSAESDPYNLVLGAVSKAVDSEEVIARFESESFLSVRRLQPVLGRSFSEAEERAGGPPVALVSHKFWQRRFAGNPDVLGKTMVLNNQTVTIVGVADPRLHPADSSFVFLPLGLQPLLLDQGDWLHDSGKTWLMLSARLRPGVMLPQAQAEGDVLAKTFEETADSGVVVFTGVVPPELQRNIGVQNLAVSLIVSMALLIACSNLASVLLARATVRRKELGVRLSLGASRARLICQLLTESMLLAIAGGILGIVFSYWLAKWLILSSVQPGTDFHLDYRVLLYGIVLSLATGFSFGFGPALAATKTNLARALHAEGLAGTPTSPVQPGWSRRNLLVVIPLAASLMLLIGSALMMQSARSDFTISTAFDASRVIEVSFRLKTQGYDEARSKQFQDELRERISAIPGVASVALASALPPFEKVCPIAIEGAGAAPGGIIRCDAVSAEFFETLGEPILRGRAFSTSDRDGSAPVAIVSQDLARNYWPDQDPLGKRVRSDSGGTFFEVVGVVSGFEDPRQLSGLPIVGPTVYVPTGQGSLLSSQGKVLARKWDVTLPPGFHADQMQFLIRAKGDPVQVKAAVRQAVRSADSSLWVSIQTVEESMERFARPLRTATVVLSFLGRFSPVDGVGGHLCAAGVLGQPAHARDRDSYGAGRAQPGDSVAGHAGEP